MQKKIIFYKSLIKVMNKTCFIPARFLSSRATVATAYRLANLLIVDDDLLAGTKAFLLIWTAF